MTMMANSQRGVALLTVLLLVVSITVVAGSMLASQKIAIRRSGVLFTQDQLLQDINAGQQLALTIIRADNQLNATDSAQDVWAQPLPPYTLGSHSVTITLRDESSRFNINNLYHHGKADSTALAMFQRLLSQLNLDPELAVAVLDWQDADSEVYNDGGDEQAIYAQQGNRASSTLFNQPFVSIEQLSVIEGMNVDALATLRPYITAVPYYLPININTASPVLLAAIIDNPTSEHVQALADRQEQQVFSTVDDLWQLPMFSVLTTKQHQTLASLLAVDSQAFRALITATDNTNTDEVRQRYATVLFSNTVSNTADVAADNNKEAATGATHSTKEVNIISQRLWVFRPDF